MEKVELTPLEWYAKVNEALTLALRDIRNEVYPKEKHLDIMQAIYPIYFNGELTLHKDVNMTRSQILEQGTLFSSVDSTNTPKGTDIDKQG